MDAWKNARNIEALQKEVAEIKKHMITLMQIVMKKEVPQAPKVDEVSKEQPKKKGWFGGEKN